MNVSFVQNSLQKPQEKPNFGYQFSFCVLQFGQFSKNAYQVQKCAQPFRLLLFPMVSKGFREYTLSLASKFN